MSLNYTRTPLKKSKIGFKKGIRHSCIFDFVKDSVLLNNRIRPFWDFFFPSLAAWIDSFSYGSSNQRFPSP